MSTTRPQRILVIGGASGIGAALILSLIQLSTAQIFLFDREIDYSPSGSLGALLNYPGRMYGHEGDVTVAEEREHAVETCIREDILGGIDTVVYCAGVITPISRIEDLDMREVEGTFNVNVFGAMGMVRSLLSIMLHFVSLTLSHRPNLHYPISAPLAQVTPSTLGLAKSSSSHPPATRL
jgi:NAD(P)-dependent dehydrogenase (short-subunit alcohol dehydrogenase family)